MFDTRGHTIFTEDGTERFNIIRYNLVGVVRPIWSLLMVDQSPSNFWIVNPHNYVYGNVAAGSSHYGFWFRSLPEPDGVSGQGLADSALNRCPNYAELLKFEGRFEGRPAAFFVNPETGTVVVTDLEGNYQYGVSLIGEALTDLLEMILAIDAALRPVEELSLPSAEDQA